jgi:hypothetical protein
MTQMVSKTRQMWIYIISHYILSHEILDQYHSIKINLEEVKTMEIKSDLLTRVKYPNDQFFYFSQV